MTDDEINPPDNSKDPSIGYYREPGAPKDVLPGEFVHASPDGNFLGVFRGGYSVMQGGPSGKSKTEVFGSHDLVRHTCADYELLTDFGVLEIYNGKGRCGLSFKGAADQLTEGGGGEQQWTFSLDIGESGDFFDMKVLNADGKIKSRFHITPDGQLEIIAVNGLSFVNGGKAPLFEESAGDVVKRFLGTITQLVSGAASYEYKGTRNTTVSESDQTIVGYNKSSMINNNLFETVGNIRQTTITGGNALTAKPSNIAVETQVLNGSYLLELGNTKLGASPAAKAGLTIAVNNGVITLGENPSPLAVWAMSAKVNLNTRIPNSIALGGTCDPSTNMALKHVAMFEPLLDVLAGMIGFYDSHVHSSPTSPPSALMSPTLSWQLAKIMSRRVLIGG